MPCFFSVSKARDKSRRNLRLQIWIMLQTFCNLVLSSSEFQHWSLTEANVCSGHYAFQHMTFYQLAAFKPWEMEVLPTPCYAPLSPYLDFHGQIGLDDCRKMLWRWPFAGWILKGLGAGHGSHLGFLTATRSSQQWFIEWKGKRD